MSPAWSKRLEIGSLVDGRVEMDFAIDLAELPRLRPQLARAEGVARGRVSFGRGVGLPMASLEVQAEAWLVCQRCLGPVRYALGGSSRLALVPDAASAEQVPEGLDAIIAADDRVIVRDLVEEELLLAMPVVPLHEDRTECGTAAEAAEETAPGAHATQQPFTQLGELLKRDH
jgi:uncharacterized protein